MRYRVTRDYKRNIAGTMFTIIACDSIEHARQLIKDNDGDYSWEEADGVEPYDEEEWVGEPRFEIEDKE